MTYGLFSDNSSVLHDSVKKIEAELLGQNKSGGTPRFEDDEYFRRDANSKGNPWIVTTLWVAQYYIKCQRPEEASNLIDWALSHAMPSGALSEQIDPESSEQLSVAPLVWSHAEMINTLLDLNNFQKSQ